MYQFLLSAHSIIRWFVLLSLFIAIYKAYMGVRSKSKFTNIDRRLRHWTATISHIQLLIGMVIYTQSPVTNYFWSNFAFSITNLELLFFGLIHGVLMLIAIVFITIGSSLSKRKKTDLERYKTMLIWFTIALIVIFIAIPWPFSPLANRPYLK